MEPAAPPTSRRPAAGRAARAAATALLWIACFDGASARAQDEGAALVLHGLFVEDHQWDALVELDADGDLEDDDDDARGPRGELATSAGASSDGSIRGSIDVDVVTAIVSERVQQVGMRAIADAISAVGAGTLASRTYVRDLVDIVHQILTGGGTLQRTSVTRLAGVLVRMVLAEAVVRTRFPEPRRLDDAAYWQGQLCRRGRGHRGQTEAGLQHCRRLSLWEPPDALEARDVHLYLLDLAYWRLGVVGLFEESTGAPPACPAAIGEPAFGLCDTLTAGADDAERDDRVDWVLNLHRIRDGLLVAKALRGAWRPDGGGLRPFLRALRQSDTVGAFGVTPGLRLEQWRAAGSLLYRVELMLRLGDLARLASTDDPAAVREEAAALYLARDDLCPERGPHAPTAAICEDPSALLDWLRALAEGAPEPQLAPPARRPRDRRPGRAATPAPPPSASPGAEPRRPPPELARALESMRRGLARLADRGERERMTAIARRLDDAAHALRVRVWGESGSGGRRVSLGGLSFESITALARDLGALLDATEDAVVLLELVPRDVWSWRDAPGARAVERTRVALRGSGRLFELLGSLNLHTAREAGLGSVRNALGGLEALVLPRDGVDQSLLVELLEPVVGHLVEGRPIEAGVLLQMVARIRPVSVLAALGRDPESPACGEPGRRRVSRREVSSLSCWVIRVMNALEEATAVTDASVRIDGAVFRDTLAALGEDFRSRHQWRWYFHLTIGLGQLMSFGGDLDPDATDDFRVLPLVAEQVGVGYASPSLAGDRLTFRTGLYASGLLYRVVFDSAESDAMLFGAFAALDLYELLEIVVAPTLMVFPGRESAADARFGLVLAAQVPLGDYLARL